MVQSSFASGVVGDPLRLCAVVGFVFVLFTQRQLRSIRTSSVPRGHSGYVQVQSTGDQARAFDALRSRFLAGYIPAMLADWMMGGHIYVLYESHGLSKEDIAMLFLVGFGSSMLFGTAVSATADRYGRRRACTWYCALYSVSALCNNFSTWSLLLVSRAAGGVATSLLYSVFEAWLVDEHARLCLPQDKLSSLFAEATFFNACSAVVGGLLAEFAVSFGGLSAPFNLSLLPLLVSAFVVTRLWHENFGDTSTEGSVSGSLWNSVGLICRSPQLVAVGTLSAAFECVLYIFVFMWTPSLKHRLRSGAGGEGKHSPAYGLLFALFMLWKMIGSNIFELVSSVRGTQLVGSSVCGHVVVVIVFILSAFSLLVLPFSGSYTSAVCAFVSYELCVGMYWPLISTLRARHVPKLARVTVLTLFRVPLNTGVMFAMLHVGHAEEGPVFGWCGAVLVAALIVYGMAQFWPSRVMKNSRSDTNIDYRV